MANCKKYTPKKHTTKTNRENLQGHSIKVKMQKSMELLYSSTKQFKMVFKTQYYLNSIIKHKVLRNKFNLKCPKPLH